MVIAATVGPPMVVVAGLRRAAPTEPAEPAPPSEARKTRRFVVDERRTPSDRSLPAAWLSGSAAPPPREPGHRRDRTGRSGRASSRRSARRRPGGAPQRRG